MAQRAIISATCDVDREMSVTPAGRRMECSFCPRSATASPPPPLLLLPMEMPRNSAERIGAGRHKSEAILLCPSCRVIVGSLITATKVPAAEATEWDKSEVDARSIYVGNVDYACLPEEVQQHFKDCGTINRVTILTDDFGHPKGYAYVEFVEVEAVQNAILLNDTKLHDRQLKVCQKRTNIPGMSHPRAWSPYQPYYPSSLTYERVPRFRRPPRYQPY